jgi:hypothetical protein
MKKISLFIFICFIVFANCEKDTTNPIVESDQKSIIGKIVDKASGQGLTGALVKISNSQNAYQTTSGTAGSFGFQNIESGEYLLKTESIENGKSLTDSCGIYNTDTPDWGAIYSSTFASIIGTIELEGQSDHSFINVQLLGTNKSALTTNQGKFRIDFIFPDTYDLFISKDENYIEIKQNNLIISQGEIFSVDTTMQYRFKPLVLEDESSLDFLDDKSAGFCYANGYFWYTNRYGLLQYDPINQLEEQVYNHNPYYLGTPYVTYDYEDGIWLTSDEPNEWYYRKYSINNSGIIDSIKTSTLPLHRSLRIAYDPINNCLVLFESYTSFYPKIHKYDLQNQNIETVNLQLEEYEFSNYKSINIEQIFIDPNGKVYFTLNTIDINDKKVLHLYVCNNTTDLNLIQIYKFPNTYASANRLSYYENEIYSTSKGKLYKLIF